MHLEIKQFGFIIQRSTSLLTPENGRIGEMQWNVFQVTQQNLKYKISKGRQILQKLQHCNLAKVQGDDGQISADDDVKILQGEILYAFALDLMPLIPISTKTV